MSNEHLSKHTQDTIDGTVSLNFIQKKNSVEKRLKEVHRFTAEDIRILFEEYRITEDSSTGGNLENLEKLEDYIIKSENEESSAVPYV